MSGCTYATDRKRSNTPGLQVKGQALLIESPRLAIHAGRKLHREGTRREHLQQICVRPKGNVTDLCRHEGRQLSASNPLYDRKVGPKYPCHSVISQDDDYHYQRQLIHSNAHRAQIRLGVLIAFGHQTSTHSFMSGAAPQAYLFDYSTCIYETAACVGIDAQGVMEMRLHQHKHLHTVTSFQQQNAFCRLQP